MAFTDEEIDAMFEGYLQRKAVKSSTRGRKKKVKAIAPQDEDYESMDLATYSQHLNSSMNDCAELAVNSFFEMERARKKGDTLKAVGYGAQGVAGASLLIYAGVEIVRAIIGNQD